MPDFAALRHGIVRIVICTGFGTQSVLLDKDGNEKPAHHSDNDGGTLAHELCPFSGVNSLTLGTVAVLLAALLIVWQRLRYAAETPLTPALFQIAALPRGPPTIL
ncbi:MAG: hypothetical protein KBA75_00920 [Alphaproteobacteria bacterium]|nr:hypothetical protein [Alphaproteobacteria bacterium]